MATPEDRQYLASVFGKREPAEAEPERKPNVVRAEGPNLPPPPDEDEQMRQFVSDLFGDVTEGRRIQSNPNEGEN